MAEAVQRHVVEPISEAVLAEAPRRRVRPPEVAAILIAEACLWRVESRVNEIDAACLGQDGGVDSRDLLGQPQKFGEADVSGHLARRSMIF
jgi:hypothetical protein